MINLTKSLSTVVDNLKLVREDLTIGLGIPLDSEEDIKENITELESVLLWFSVIIKNLKSVRLDIITVKNNLLSIEDEDAELLCDYLEEVVDKLSTTVSYLKGQEND